MTTRTWLGGTHDIADPNAWSPAGAPQPGDTAIIGVSAGRPENATASYQTLDGYTIDLTTRVDFPGAMPPSLDITSTLLGSGLAITGQANPYGGYGVIRAVGANVNAGTILAPAYQSLAIDISDVVAGNGVVVTPGSLLNTGTISSSYLNTQLAIDGQSPYDQLINDGTLDAFGTLSARVALTGSGVIALYSPQNGGYNGVAQLYGGVGAGQTLDFAFQQAANQGVPYQPQLQLYDPQRFYGAIENFAQGGTIVLENVAATTDSYANGVLTVSNGSGVVARLRFDGGYAASQFQLAAAGGSTQITVSGQPMGNATAPNTGELAVPTPPTTPIAQSGSVTLTTGDWTASDATIGSQVTLAGSAAGAPSLDVTGTAFASQASVVASGSGGLDLVGSNANQGVIVANGGSLAVALTDLTTPAGGIGGAVNINPGALLNSGTIAAAAGGSVALSGDADARLINAGTLEVQGAGTLSVGVGVVGAGSVQLDPDGNGTAGTIAFGGSVAASQSVTFNGAGTLRLDDPATFAATVQNFGGGAEAIILTGQTVTADSYANGVLTLQNGSSVVANLHLAGNYTSNDFQLGSSGGNTVITAPGVRTAMRQMMAGSVAAPDIAAAPIGQGAAVGQQVQSAGRFAAAYDALLHQHAPVVVGHG